MLAPASLAGYEAVLKPNDNKTNLVVSLGDGTWAQAGMVNDANANDYAAGTFDYFQTGLNTAVLTNVDIGMFSALGITNVTTVNLTFTSGNGANYAWTNENSSGTGTMTFTPVGNLAPASLAGKTIQIFQKTTLVSTIALASDGTFTSTNKFGDHYGTYDFTPYSPTVAILHSDFNDPSNAGGDTVFRVDLYDRHHRASIGQLLHQPGLRH